MSLVVCIEMTHAWWRIYMMLSNYFLYGGGTDEIGVEISKSLLFGWQMCVKCVKTKWIKMICISVFGYRFSAFGLRSKCSICSRRFESRRWLKSQALSNGFLDIGWDHPSILGPVPRIVSARAVTLRLVHTRFFRETGTIILLKY
jgi:hypothetical protein